LGLAPKEGKFPVLRSLTLDTTCCGGTQWWQATTCRHFFDAFPDVVHFTLLRSAGIDEFVDLLLFEGPDPTTRSRYWPGLRTITIDSSDPGLRDWCFAGVAARGGAVEVEVCAELPRWPPGADCDAYDDDDIFVSPVDRDAS